MARRRAATPQRPKPFVLAAGNPSDIDNAHYCPRRRFERAIFAQRAAADVLGQFLDNARKYSTDAYNDLISAQREILELTDGFWINRGPTNPGCWVVDLRWTKVEVRLWRE